MMPISVNVTSQQIYSKCGTINMENGPYLDGESSENELDDYPGYFKVFRRDRSSINMRENEEPVMNFVENREVRLRRRSSAIPPFDPFQKYPIPDLVIENIFEFLCKRDISNAMRCCRRFYNIGEASKFWTNFDLGDKRITEFTLAALLRRNTQYLRLADAKCDQVNTCELKPYHSKLFGKIPCSLKLLDLSRAILNKKQLAMLLKPCQNLVGLSLENQTIDDEIASHIAKNPHLRRLDLSMTKGLTEFGLQLIVEKCRSLEELSLAWCGLSQSTCAAISKRLTSTLRKLNISGTLEKKGVTDCVVLSIGQSCPYLNDLDISDNIEVTKTSIVIVIRHLPKLRTLSCNRCYGIDPNTFLNLTTTGIRHLNVHGCISESNLETFYAYFPNMDVNKTVLNYTAKPYQSETATHRIWGHSLR
ncbi:unnamed protein product [Caenorhabditis bovis]|uniref:F-box domain-containing protein n=1 Tax=Caenorhabditis bovis TaxID=2654633 RepID=A0A8S1EQX1_9PELO|nr:unnamed protein product [Caenorhabditis bovis]